MIQALGGRGKVAILGRFAVDGIFCTNDEFAMGAVAAVEAAGKGDAPRAVRVVARQRRRAMSAPGRSRAAMRGQAEGEGR